MSVGGKEDKDSSPICFWAGTSPTEKNFYVRRNGYLFSKYGQIGNWFIGEGGLYSKGGDKKFTKDGSGVYVGSDGIRLGSNFYVETSGKIYALTGNIGNCDISSGGISQKDGAWSIDASGSAKFTNATINGKSIVDLVGFYSKGGAGGGTTLGGGATINPGAGGVTVPNGKTLDKHTEQLIVETLKTDELWSKIGVINSLKVNYLNAYGLRVGDREVSFDEDDISQIYTNKDDIADLAKKVRDLESKISTLKT